MATSSPHVHMQHPMLRFAPSTVQRYLFDWHSCFCHALFAPSHDPPPGALPDWLATRMSKQGLATSEPWRGWRAPLACQHCSRVCSFQSSVPLPLLPPRPSAGRVCHCLCPLLCGSNAVLWTRLRLRPRLCSSALSSLPFGRPSVGGTFFGCPRPVCNFCCPTVLFLAPPSALRLPTALCHLGWSCLVCPARRPIIGVSGF